MAVQQQEGSLIAVIGDEDTVTGFLLAGVGSVDLRKTTNFLVVNDKTTVRQVEDTFKDFTQRDNIAIILINQFVADLIRHLLDNFQQATPAILEIPSKDQPYDPTKDSILSRVKFMTGDA